MSVLSRDKENSELEHEPRKRNKLAMPDVFVILFGFLILAFIMTYVIPSGAFERVDQDGITQVVPDSFQHINADQLSVLDLFSAVQKGMVNAAGIIFIILIAGGVIRIIEYTGAVDSGVNALLRKSRGRQNVLIIAFCGIFALICSMGVAPNLAVAFVPIGLLLARKLRLDPVVGVAGAVIVVLKDAQVVDTIVHAVASALSQLTPVLSMVMLYIFNLLFNGIVSSGAGQAAIVMPVMVPIGDMLEVTRQTVFITFKLGDAVTNIITPLSGTLMACLAIANVSYVKWVKFVFPLLLIWVVLGGIFVAAAVLINYGPF